MDQGLNKVQSVDLFERGYYAMLNGMGGPEDEGTPAESLIPEGNPAWNGLVQYIPEDKRSEAAGILKEWDSSYNKLQEEHAPYKEYVKNNIDPAYLQSAMDVMYLIENQPQRVFEALQSHLGDQQTGQSTVEEPELTDEEEGNPELTALQQQVETMSKIMLSQRQTEINQAEQRKQDEQLDKELIALKEKHGEFPEDEVVMRMLHKGLNAEDAYKEFTAFASEIRRRQAAPYLLGSGGQIPKPSVDVKTLDNKATKDLVVQMLGHSATE